MFESEIAKRKTFAIIAHPDAGKTTLTEKFLLFGGQIQTAGAVKSNKITKATTSDFMEIEKQRGISVATSVMSFHYKNKWVNILDTPGHKDFAEDTYRTLTAVDSVILVVDCVKGVEEQTEKLMEVCRMRNTPVIVFVNKMDRDGKDPFDLLEELEGKLNIGVHPMSWPINGGKDFKGVYLLHNQSLNLFESSKTKKADDVVKINGLADTQLDKILNPKNASKLRDDAELIEGVYGDLPSEDYLAGKTAPVFFGSALNSFGIQELLDTFIEIAPNPLPRATTKRDVEPNEPKFSGFIFKIHANLDPKHRDRIAFLRVCSGRFERGMKIKQVSTGKLMAVNNAITFMAQDRTTMDEAYSGDIIGIPNHGTIKVGDTFSENENLKFTGLPSFAPEFFRKARLKNPLKMKQLQKGLQQLAEEGASQLFRPILSNDLILGAVGMLQFEVVAHRLEHEYGVDIVFENYDCYTARWLRGKDSDLSAIADKYGFNVAMDGANEYVYLAPNRVNLQMAQERYPYIEFLETRELT